MNHSREPIPETEAALLKREVEHQGRLSLFRATLNEELAQHGALHNGSATAIYVHRDYTEAAPTRVETLVMVTSPNHDRIDKLNNQAIRIIVNEKSLGHQGSTWLIRDLTITERNRLQYMIDISDPATPNYPVEEMTGDEIPDSRALLPLFYVDNENNQLVLTRNFDITPGLGIVKSRNETIYPLGRMGHFYDEEDALTFGFEMIAPLPEATLLYTGQA